MASTTATTAPMVLHIGDQSFASWSLRPWLALKMGRIPFEEQKHRLLQPTTRAVLAKVSPSARVPTLHVPAVHFAGAAVAADAPPVVIWDSLAIMEFAAERAPSLWPANAAARAVARALCAEMHAGFAALRQHMCLDVLGSVPYAADKYPAEVHADIARIFAAWRDARQRFGAPSGQGPFLFGAFTNVDAMYAPVVMRFRTYNVPLPDDIRAYADAILALPAVHEWVEGARREAA